MVQTVQSVSSRPTVISPRLRQQIRFQAVNYLPAHPEVPALQADLKSGSGRFKRANYLSPEILYDRGNEWSDYFKKEFPW